MIGITLSLQACRCGTIFWTWRRDAGSRAAPSGATGAGLFSSCVLADLEIIGAIRASWPRPRSKHSLPTSLDSGSSPHRAKTRPSTRWSSCASTSGGSYPAGSSRKPGGQESIWSSAFGVRHSRFGVWGESLSRAGDLQRLRIRRESIWATRREHVHAARTCSRSSRCTRTHSSICVSSSAVDRQQCASDADNPCRNAWHALRRCSMVLKSRPVASARSSQNADHRAEVWSTRRSVRRVSSTPARLQDHGSRASGLPCN